MLPAPGAQITQNIRLVRLLGQGGMGSVWLAEHLTLRTQVAVKLISADQNHEPDAQDRFTREAVAIASLRSPHVVQVYDHGVFHGQPFIVMELLVGQDLGQRIDRTGPVPFAELTAVISQVGKAIGAAHAAGIIHRDIKPANVFLTDAGGELHVKLLDFGVAKTSAPTGDPKYKKTQTGQLIGTPCYMSPEQVFGGGETDHQVDLWAFGVLVYEALTGQLPFPGATIGDVYVSIHQGIFRPPSEHLRASMPAVDAWFTRAFARDPRARFGTIKEMVDSFTTTIANAPPAVLLSASSLPTVNTARWRGGRTTGRGPLKLGIVGAVVGAGLVAVLAFGGVANRRPGVAASSEPRAPTATTTATAPTVAPVVVSPAPSAEAPAPSASASAAVGARISPAGAASGRGRLPAPAAPTAAPKGQKYDHGF